ncbi:hypothetical protein BATDEDRAFT_16063 [Batrachochytrium dendrobatidis JAM81]|uniref:protein-tyrosine-phosphatase n=2 Tax=Batrachochytrium dendrobatidis TaxID=109871 RepID=F4NZ92_BATDJ|nr:uncharacterized protein BATDEDRAFT_16063 [Batrachochytrium dendrobatidis JAM81]EGF82155.1 hypothetical protein BATDEDRAFT_16063 [Batrachochytrium dendrobatidis JAM81]KAJ8324615.1 Protein tyrosine phosphatase type IVA 2 [Batrachochytrium dendrobatidis]KAK5670865.1 Protein tyrosine phosphatase type IVA 2 [Batrachochytrium dendrobatidis]OAJ40462.1 protein-tyrosine phosphatase [Batrachochytrium dendrobatidis JEL423]|eukprot:XP_006677183.1 hypothetical protein BATDEDRAFT_16063 [Batrachochytrium dendrobatidis JAM81]
MANTQQLHLSASTPSVGHAASLHGTVATVSNTSTAALDSPLSNNFEKTPSQSSVSSGRTSPTRSHLTRIFSQFEIGRMRFVILDCPTDATLPEYLKELKSRGVTDVVRVCEPTYATNLLHESNISVHDWPFKDGGVPTLDIIKNFLTLADTRFGGLSLEAKDKESANQACIAVHCVAGLGRAPVLVALTLIEAGMAPLDAVAFVRKYRRGAFNSIQLTYLVDTYKRSYNKRPSAFSNFLSGKRTSSNSHSSNGSSPASDVSTNAHSNLSGSNGSINASNSTLSGLSSNAASLRQSLSKVFGLRRPASNSPTLSSASTSIPLAIGGSVGFPPSDHASPAPAELTTF